MVRCNLESLVRPRRFISIDKATVSFLALLFCGLLHSTTFADDGLKVTGTDGTSHNWTAARLKDDLAAEVKAVEYTSRGQKHTAHGVALLAVLKAAGIPAVLKMDPQVDPKLKNLNLRLAVVIRGGDGYTATFSLAELLPDIGGREAWLAFDEDGKPLPNRDGASKLIVPADQKLGRWVRNVTVITVVDPAPPATQSAAPEK
jgi:hypothetical protein